VGGGIEMRTVILLVFLSIFTLVGFAEDKEIKEIRQNINQAEQAVIEQKSLLECVKAGGRLEKSKECDGSEIDWCNISEKEQCYADQVHDGKCTAGKYSEELKAIVGISPRILCDKYQ
jgi:hypothetical protein